MRGLRPAQVIWAYTVKKQGVGSHRERRAVQPVKKKHLKIQATASASSQGSRTTCTKADKFGCWGGTF